MHVQLKLRITKQKYDITAKPPVVQALLKLHNTTKSLKKLSTLIYLKYRSDICNMLFNSAEQYCG